MKKISFAGGVVVKIEIGKEFPQYFKSLYPEEFEAFLSMECILREIKDLSGARITAMVIGQVQHISVEESYARGYEQRYGKNGFMMLIPAPQDLVTGEPNQSTIASVHIEKYD